MMCGRAWTTTPLDFVDANGPGWAMKVQPFMGMPVLPRERPLPNAYKVQEYLLCLATLLSSLPASTSPAGILRSSRAPSAFCGA